MWEKRKEKKKPTGEKVGQDLASPFCDARPARQAWRNNRRIAALRIHCDLTMVASMHNEGPEGPHVESSATCVQWCGWRLVQPS